MPVMNSKLYPLVRLMKLRKLSQVRLAKKRFRPPTIHTVVTKWIAGKNGKQSFLYNIEPLIEFLDKSYERE